MRRRSVGQIRQKPKQKEGERKRAELSIGQTNSVIVKGAIVQIHSSSPQYITDRKSESPPLGCVVSGRQFVEKMEIGSVHICPRLTAQRTRTVF